MDQAYREIDQEMLAEIRRSPFVAVDTETTGLHFDDRVVGVGVAWIGDDGDNLNDRMCSVYLNVGHAPSLFFPVHPEASIRALIGVCFERPHRPVYMHNSLFDLEKLHRWGLCPMRPAHTSMIDTQPVARLALPFGRKEGTGLAHLCDRMVPGGFPPETAAMKKMRKRMGQLPAEQVVEYGKTDAEMTLKLGVVLQNEMYRIYGSQKATELLEHKARFLQLLLRMQLKGVLLDEEFIEEQKERLGALAAKAKAKLAEAGLRDPGSRSDLLAFFGGSGLPRTAKGNPSVNKAALEAVGGEMAETVLAWRGYTKAISTWLEGYQDKVAMDGRLHPRFHGAGTISGRLSCREPNLQAVPLDNNRGHSFGSMRGLFKAREGYKLLAFDYAQAELRMVTSYSGSDKLAAIFASGEDLHTTMAKEMWPDRGITRELRQLGKTATYTSTYGGGAGALSEATGISEKEARAVMARRKKAFPKVAAMQNKAGKIWAGRGYMVTVSGRRRYMGDNERGREYAGFNQLIQGGVADVIEKAMLAVDEYLTGEDLGYLVLQVHDSIEVEIREESAEDTTEEIKRLMAEAYPGWLRERTDPPIEFEVDNEEW